MASLKIDPRSPYWFACITLPDGRQTQKSTKLRHKEVSRAKAQKYADTLESAYRQRRAENQFRRFMNQAWQEISGKPLPFSSAQSFLEGWLERRKAEVSHTSLLRYTSVVRDFLEFLGPKAGEDLSGLASADIRSFRDHQAARLSATSANLSVAIIRNALKSAIRAQLIAENVAGVDFIDPIKRRNENHKRRAFTLSELQKLLAAAEGSEWKGLILAGLYLGQRLGDIARLTWANVNLEDLEHSEISIATEKTGRVQIIPLADPLTRYITEELAMSEDPAAPLFPRAYENAHRLGRVSSLSRQFHDLLVSAGLATPHGEGREAGEENTLRRTVHPLSFHSLRHTATSFMKSAGVNNAVAMDLVGHQSTAISAHYTTIDQEAKRKAINLMPDVTAGDSK
jgi:integrase